MNPLQKLFQFGRKETTDRFVDSRALAWRQLEEFLVAVEYQPSSLSEKMIQEMGRITHQDILALFDPNPGVSYRESLILAGSFHLLALAAPASHGRTHGKCSVYLHILENETQFKDILTNLTVNLKEEINADSGGRDYSRLANVADDIFKRVHDWHLNDDEHVARTCIYDFSRPLLQGFIKKLQTWAYQPSCAVGQSQQGLLPGRTNAEALYPKTSRDSDGGKPRQLYGGFLPS